MDKKEETSLSREVKKTDTLLRMKDAPKLYLQSRMRDAFEKKGINPDYIAAKTFELFEERVAVMEPLRVPLKDDHGVDIFEDKDGMRVPKMTTQQTWDPEAKKFITTMIVVDKPNVKAVETALRFVQQVLVEKDPVAKGEEGSDHDPEAAKRVFQSMSKEDLSQMLSLMQKAQRAKVEDAQVAEYVEVPQQK